MVDIRLPDPSPLLPTGARTSALPTDDTPVTMERAFAFGFKAGLGFIAAQILFGVALAALYYSLPSLLRLAAG